MTMPAFDIPDGGVILQGATGRIGRKHMALMRAYGTPIVAGVSPKVEDAALDGIPLFTSATDASSATKAVASVVMVPPMQVLDAIADGIKAGLKLIVTVTEGMPVADAMRALAMTREAGVNWVGASTPGLAIPGKLKLGFLPDVALAPGNIGFASKSGTLSYEIGYRLVASGFGQSAWIGVGGDPVKGTRFADLMPFFQKDDNTRAVAIIGEIGGNEEEQLAEAVASGACAKPIYAIIAGHSAREGVAMGHAGAMVDGETGTITSKTQALESAGIKVFTNISKMIDVMSDELAGGPVSEDRNVYATNG